MRASCLVRFVVIRAEHGERFPGQNWARLPPRTSPSSSACLQVSPCPSGPRFSRSSSSASACLQQLVRAPASVPASVSGSDDDRATPAPIQCPRPGEDYPCTLCPTLLVDACKRWLLSLVQWAEFHRLSSPEWKKTLFWIGIIGVRRFRESEDFVWLLLDG